MTAADEGRQEPRTAGSLSHADLGREVTVTPVSMTYRGRLMSVEHKTSRTKVRVYMGNVGATAYCTADTPVHVHDEEAGR